MNIKSLLIISILLLAFSVNGQDPQLFEHTWYLQAITVDGETHAPPNLDIEPQTGGVQFLEGEDKVALYYCDGYDQSINYDSDEGFSLEGETLILEGTCGAPENWDYTALYFSVFYNLGIARNPFFYTISTDTNGAVSLVIINPDGDEALYGNELLANSDFSTSDFYVYPNPVKNELFISENVTSTIKGITIYDMHGRTVIIKKNITGSIQVENLNSGLYFALFEGKNGMAEIKKIIKI